MEILSKRKQLQRCRISMGGRNAQLHLHTRIELTPDRQLTAHKFGAFAYAMQAVVSFAAVSTKNLRVNALSVVPDAQPELPLSANNKGENIARSMFYSGVLLFIGASPAGASDPHLSRLLEPFSELYGPVLDYGSSPPHFLLGMKDMPAHEQTKLRSLGIEPILYASHSDLSRFIVGIDNRPAMVPVSSIPEFTRSLVSNSSAQNPLGATLKYVGKHLFQKGSMSTVSLFRKTSHWRGNKSRDLVCYANEAPRNKKLPYPLSFATWALITGRIIASSRFGESGLRGTNDTERDVRELKRRGKWDVLRKDILSAIGKGIRTPKKDNKDDEGKSATLISLELLEEINESFSETNRRQSLRMLVGCDRLFVPHLYHSFGLPDNREELHRDRTIVCVPIPQTGKSDPPSQAEEISPDHVLCIDIPKGLNEPLSQSQIDHLTLVSDCLYLASSNWLRSLNL